MVKKIIKSPKIKRFTCKTKRGVKGSIFATSFKEAKNLGKRHGCKLTR